MLSYTCNALSNKNLVLKHKNECKKSMMIFLFLDNFVEGSEKENQIFEKILLKIPYNHYINAYQ